ncbi:GGDEF domain-containing protein [Streptomyces sp. TRM66268-LWL]|uniref:GGDEF domain-containing protein n=1 Tax=Streptomyces polyasparticus TaxID=2767826 RepID=A0ABR7SV91_9ACTN|nr:GGDEF domain-containing protein [Streptomyces polyasparticus]MBC9718451.1 GGDEF domain-containing protein [Streptomyces polyasparticus]
MDPRTKAPDHACLHASVPLFDPSRLPLRSWCEGSREDPLTGLIAFPDFHSHLPREIATALAGGQLIALAIGDVDGLKHHVEHANAHDDTSFGHLAGNKVMARLGAITRHWFHQQRFSAGCAATFGGDEVIVAAAIDDPTAFHQALAELRDQLCAALPTTVSFAFTVAAPEHLPHDTGARGWRHAFSDRLLATVDRALFAHKKIRNDGQGGVIAVVEAPRTETAQVAPRASLLSLPAAGSVLHIMANPAVISGRPMLLLPCKGPVGLRGARVRLTVPQHRPRTSVVVSIHGQAAVLQPSPGGEGPVPAQLEPVRGVQLGDLPADLRAALDAAGLSWDTLPVHERAQMLHLIRESATADIRRARVTAAVSAASAHARRRS